MTKVLIRADASETIGWGHVMRCLALAGALSKRGARVTFLSCPLPPALADQIRADGHDIDTVGTETGHSGSAEDAWRTRTALLKYSADWLITDHYGINADWDRTVLTGGVRHLALDDLADRPRVADLLLNQTLGQVPERYAGLLPSGAKVLAGPRYSLLRPDFAAKREGSLARRLGSSGRIDRVLISLGGGAHQQALFWILETLAGAPAAAHWQLIITSSASPSHARAISSRISTLGLVARLAINSGDMAELMATSDLALGGAGGTAWERCSLGLPAIVTVLAENQRPGADALARIGAALSVEVGQTKALIDAVTGLASEPKRLAAMSSRAATVCDGLGAPRVAALLLNGV